MQLRFGFEGAVCGPLGGRIYTHRFLLPAHLWHCTAVGRLTACMPLMLILFNAAACRAFSHLTGGGE